MRKLSQATRETIKEAAFIIILGLIVLGAIVIVGLISGYWGYLQWLKCL